jgi:hypothetical protein
MSVAKALVEVAGAAVAVSEGIGPRMDGVAVFIWCFLGLILFNLASKLSKSCLHHRVFTDVVQLYIHDACHSQW